MPRQLWLRIRANAFRSQWCRFDSKAVPNQFTFSGALLGSSFSISAYKYGRSINLSTHLHLRHDFHFSSTQLSCSYRLSSWNLQLFQRSKMATAAFMVRERPPPLHSELLSRPDICFCHPGFDPPGNELLTLPRVDSTVAAGVYGVHHRTALLACQIIAGNAFDSSRFTFDREGQHEVQVPLDGVLIHEQYYFIVPGSCKCFLLSFAF